MRQYIIPQGTPYNAYRYVREKELPYQIMQSGKSIHSAVYSDADVLPTIGTDIDRTVYIFFSLPEAAKPLVVVGVLRKYVILLENGVYTYLMEPDVDIAKVYAELKAKAS